MNVPEYFNSGSDVIDAWAKRDRTTLAMIRVSQKGEQMKYRYLDLSNLSDKEANILVKYNINKGDRVLVGSPDRIRGMIVKAFVVLKNGYEPSESVVRDIKNSVKRTTAPSTYPREIECIAELPKTISNKIKRNELREAELKKYTGTR